MQTVCWLTKQAGKSSSTILFLESIELGEGCAEREFEGLVSPNKVICGINRQKSKELGQGIKGRVRMMYLLLSDSWHFPNGNRKIWCRSLRLSHFLPAVAGSAGFPLKTFASVYSSYLEYIQQHSITTMCQALHNTESLLLS